MTATSKDDTIDPFYYALVLADFSVISILKNNPKIRVSPADIHLLIHYIKTNYQNLAIEQPLFAKNGGICMPGMTEQYKLAVFFHFDKVSNLKMVYVCEEASPDLYEHLVGFGDSLFSQFNSKNLASTVLLYENNMR